jgi:hypothetical protein
VPPLQALLLLVRRHALEPGGLVHPGDLGEGLVQLHAFAAPDLCQRLLFFLRAARGPFLGQACLEFLELNRTMARSMSPDPYAMSPCQ